MTTTVTVRLNEKEKQLLQEYAKTGGITVSELIRTSMLEKIEDEYDLKAYEQAILEDDGTRYSHEEVMKELGL